MRFALFLVIFLTLLSCCLSQSPKIQKLGILLHYQKGNSAQLKAYLTQLINPLCPAILQFNIILHSNAQAQINKIKGQLAEYVSSEIPVNFYQSTPKEDVFKFRIPKESKAQIYYVSSIYINEETCEDIGKYLTLVQKRAIGGLIGVVGEIQSYNSIQADLRRKQSQIFYYDKIEGLHYCLVQDIRIISKHLLQISQSSIRQVTQMANAVTDLCQQVFLNFLSSHFYPQLLPFGYKFATSINQLLDQAVEYNEKNACLRKFINVLGYMPVYYQRKDFKEELWVNPNAGKVVEMKKEQLRQAIGKSKMERRMWEGGYQMLEYLGEDIAYERTEQGFWQQVVVMTLIGMIVVLATLTFFFLFKTCALKRIISKLPCHSK